MEYVFEKATMDPDFPYRIAAINLSLGSPTTSTSECDTAEPLRKTATLNLKSVGIATVVSTGNQGVKNGISAPACITTAISVASTTKGIVFPVSNPEEIISSFSNNDDQTDVLATGGESTMIPLTSQITSSMRTNSDPNNVIADPAFGYLIGTSMSAPHVTGAIALLKEKDRTLTVDEIESALETTGVSITDTRMGGGPPATAGAKPRIDVDDALASFDPTYCGKTMSDFINAMPTPGKVIEGTDGDDILAGTEGPDLIFGGDGDDHIQGLAGDDCIFGEGGNDVISGGAGNDEISGGPGNDQITGRAGDDTLYGNDGNDIISGGDDNDVIDGHAGLDQLTGRAGNDHIDGSADFDRCSGGPGTDTVNTCWT